MDRVDYSFVARAYVWIEYLVFGRALESARLAHLQEVTGCLKKTQSARLLLVGDGDGRFLERLLHGLPSDAVVDYVDCCAGMLEVAKRRVGGDPRVRWHCQQFEGYHGGGYDVVTMHFFLDHYGEAEREVVLQHLLEMLNPGCLLLVSDFDPSVSLARRAQLRLMQLFFIVTSRVSMVEVARADELLEWFSFQLVAESQWQGGWIYSQCWRFLPKT